MDGNTLVYGSIMYKTIIYMVYIFNDNILQYSIDYNSAKKSFPIVQAQGSTVSLTNNNSTVIPSFKRKIDIGTLLPVSVTPKPSVDVSLLYETGTPIGQTFNYRNMYEGTKQIVTYSSFFVNSSKTGNILNVAGKTLNIFAVVPNLNYVKKIQCIITANNIALATYSFVFVALRPGKAIEDWKLTAILPKTLTSVTSMSFAITASFGSTLILNKYYGSGMEIKQISIM